VTPLEADELDMTYGSACDQFIVIAARGFSHILRDAALYRMHVFITLAVATLLGFTYYKIGIDIAGSQDRFGLLFFIVIYFSMVSMSSIGAFTKELDLFNRERARGYYSTAPFFFSKLLTDFIPFRVIPPMFFSAIVYFMVGLQFDMVRFYLFVIVVILTNLVATSICFAFSALYGNVGMCL
jgi:hypothetical protein